MDDQQIYAMIKQHHQRALATVNGKTRWTKLLVFSAVVALLLFWGGRSLGVVAKTQTIIAQHQLVVDLISAKFILPDELRAQLVNIEKVTEDTFFSRYGLTLAYFYAATHLPERNLYLQKTLNEISYLLAKNDAPNREGENFLPPTLSMTATDKRSSVFSLKLMLSAMLLELNDDEKSAAILSTIEVNELTTAQENEYLNALAYLLAVGEKVRTPNLTLQYAQKIVPAWQAHENAEELDTLAMAYFANRKIDVAMQIEKRAWGLAKGYDLWTYQENYRKIVGF